MQEISCEMCHRWEDQPDLRIHRFAFCDLLLHSDQRYPGYCLLIAREHVTELFHLSSLHRTTVMQEVALVAEVLADLFQATKINYELLGNKVPHMHWHLIPRKQGDYVWPRPVWAETLGPMLLCREEYQQRCRLIRHRIEEALGAV